MENNQKQIKYDMKKALEEYMPSLIKLIGKKEISWTSINKGYRNHVINLREKLENSNTDVIEKDTTFYSFIIGHILGREETIAEYNYFNHLFSQLYERLSEEELDLIHKMITPLLTKFDFNFRNFIGELSTLNAYKSTGNYTLLNIEEKPYSQNNVSADLYLKRNDDNKLYLVEIVNIHLERRDIEKLNELKLFLNSKIKEKVKVTFYNFPKCDIYIQPVVWVKNIEQVKLISELYKGKHIKEKNVFEAMIPLTFKDQNSFEHRFEYASTILDDNINLSRPFVI